MVVVNDVEYLCDEERRLKEDRERKRYWKKWGPYVAERQWATGTFSSKFADCARNWGRPGGHQSYNPLRKALEEIDC